MQQQQRQPASRQLQHYVLHGTSISSGDVDSLETAAIAFGCRRARSASSVPDCLHWRLAGSVAGVAAASAATRHAIIGGCLGIGRNIRKLILNLSWRLAEVFATATSCEQNCDHQARSDWTPGCEPAGCLNTTDNERAAHRHHIHP
jgi:hypothetical protein